MIKPDFYGRILLEALSKCWALPGSMGLFYFSYLLSAGHSTSMSLFLTLLAYIQSLWLNLCNYCFRSLILSKYLFHLEYDVNCTFCVETPRLSTVYCGLTFLRVIRNNYALIYHSFEVYKTPTKYLFVYLHFVKPIKPSSHGNDKKH